ncbi:hypothetical protein KW460_21630, partial [Vibrio fluvialis]|nr:hypothetical protein [Vibrio fluvialis]
ALNSGEWIIRFFLFVMVHLVSDCTHLTRCPKLVVRISFMMEQFFDVAFYGGLFGGMLGAFVVLLLDYLVSHFSKP